MIFGQHPAVGVASFCDTFIHDESLMMSLQVLVQLNTGLIPRDQWFMNIMLLIHVKYVLILTCMSHSMNATKQIKSEIKFSCLHTVVVLQIICQNHDNTK